MIILINLFFKLWKFGSNIKVNFLRIQWSNNLKLKCDVDSNKIVKFHM